MAADLSITLPQSGVPGKLEQARLGVDGYRPVVDGSPLAKVLGASAMLVGAAMCPTYLCGT